MPSGPLRGTRVLSGSPGRRAVRNGRWLGLLLVPAVLAACTGSPVKIDPATASNAVVASADRIRGGQTRLGGATACLESEYCAAGLSRVYGINLGAGGVTVDPPSAVAEALAAGAIDVGALPAGAVEAADARLKLLRDDRQLQPADNVIPVAGPALGALAVPLAAAVDRISASLDQAGLTGIERALAGGTPPDLAAQTWLDRAAAPPVAAPPPGAARVVIGTRGDAESEALSDLYAGALARAGWAVETAPVGGGRWGELDALALGRVGLVPDTTTDLLETVVGFTATATASLQRDLVLLRARLADRGLAAFNPAPASPRTVFAVARAVAAILGVSTLSGLARVSGAAPVPAAAPPPLTPADVAADTEGPAAPVPPSLGIGSAGLVVIAVQQRLIQLGYLHGAGSATGMYDEPTRRAMVAFQTDAGLLSDGAADALTLRALGSAHAPAHPGVAPGPGDPDSLHVPPQVTGGPSTLYLAVAGGPSDVTPLLLDALRRDGDQATFFVDEQALSGQPDTVRQIAAAGDAVGVTAAPHNAASAAATDVLFRTVASDQEAVAAVDGRTPSCFLAPYGATDAATRARASQLGLRTVLSDVDPQDWRHPGADAIAADVAVSVHPGSVVLLHDGGGDRAQTVAAVETILGTLGALGYRFAPLPGC